MADLMERMVHPSDQMECMLHHPACLVVHPWMVTATNSNRCPECMHIKEQPNWHSRHSTHGTAGRALMAQHSCTALMAQQAEHSWHSRHSTHGTAGTALRHSRHSTHGTAGRALMAQHSGTALMAQQAERCLTIQLSIIVSHLWRILIRISWSTHSYILNHSWH